jgi:glycosyltransferase involved in cell wall biosynthesis
MAYAGRSPRPLLEALAGAPDLADRVEVLFAGPLSAEERAVIEAAPAARAVGTLDRERTLALEAASDSLVVLTSGRRRGEATQKVFEYLAAAKPILVLGQDTEAARIVHRAGAGVVAPTHDPAQIADAVRMLLALDGAKRLPERSAIERYSYEALAAEMAEQVERAIAAAR